ncbi:MAG: hypothetical protein ACPHDO_05625, partial [Candidatus Poseidoniaceae archaeon]
ALLREPIFDAGVIKSNYEHLCNFRRKFATRETTAHDRFYLYENIPLSNTISLLNSLKCNKTAIQDSYADYARYLKDWSEADDMPPIPNINIAIKNSMGKRRRESSTSKPESAEEARRKVTGMFGPILGGKAHGTYLGDYFVDKDIEWHKQNPNAKPSTPREAGDSILILFYLLEPNYVRNRIFDPKDTDDDNPFGKWKAQQVYLEEGDSFYVDVPKGKEDDYPVLVFAAFTPLGGPKYALGVNSLLNPDKIKQVGLTKIQEELIQEEDE